MLVDWSSGGSRWMAAGVISLVLHVVLLSLLVSTSESDEESGRGVPAATAKEEVASGADAEKAPQPQDGEEKAPQASDVPSADIGRSVPDAAEPSPQTPETTAPAEHGSLASIGARFDESARVQPSGVSNASARKAPAKPRTPEPRKAAAPKPEKAEKPTAKDYTWYTVKPGESLTRIARDTGMTPLALAQLNGFKKPLSVRLRVGQKIKIKAK